MTCPIVQPWVGRPCGGPAEANGRCTRHASYAQCTGCGRPATLECSFAGSIAVCGAPVCGTCEHRDSYARHYPVPDPPRLASAGRGRAPIDPAHFRMSAVLREADAELAQRHTIDYRAHVARTCDCPCHEARRARGCGCCSRAQ